MYSKEVYQERKESNLCTNCGTKPPLKDNLRCSSCREHQLKCYRRNKERYNEKVRLHHRKLRQDALDAYGGPRCVCCGETQFEFLTIDHERGDGAEHRKQIRRKPIYGWLKANNYPRDLGLRVLCFNCNCSKSSGNSCPHENDEGYEYDCSVGLLQYAS